MNKQYNKGDLLKVTTDVPLLSSGWEEGVVHFGHLITLDYEMDSYVAGVCSCDLYIYPYKGYVEAFDHEEALLTLEVNIAQVKELEKKLAVKLAEGIESLVKFCDDLAAKIEPKVKH
jgi:hypothetical protein